MNKARRACKTTSAICANNLNRRSRDELRPSRPGATKGRLLRRLEAAASDVAYAAQLWAMIGNQNLRRGAS